MSAKGRRDGWWTEQSRSGYGSSSHRAQCALLLSKFAELEPLCRPKADAMGGGPSKVEAVTAPPAIGRSALSRSPSSRSWSLMSAKGRRDGWWTEQSRSGYGSSSYRAQCALLLAKFAELEPLCRPKADAVADSRCKAGGVTVPPATGRGAPFCSLGLQSLSICAGCLSL